MYCSNCGSYVSDKAVVCVNCGCAVGGNQIYVDQNASDKNGLVTLLLAIFVGYFGVHRFYVGKIGTGVLMFISLGFFGLWTLIDIIRIAVGSFTDDQGRRIQL